MAHGALVGRPLADGCRDKQPVHTLVLGGREWWCRRETGGAAGRGQVSLSAPADKRHTDAASKAHAGITVTQNTMSQRRDGNKDGLVQAYNPKAYAKAGLTLTATFAR